MLGVKNTKISWLQLKTDKKKNKKIGRTKKNDERNNIRNYDEYVWNERIERRNKEKRSKIGSEKKTEMLPILQKIKENIEKQE